ncbi:MAG: transporter substrate-binding protein [Actinomycetia bacterium]|nr:transporter substrate-binding protein [Actinomycetes bacterium]
MAIVLLAGLLAGCGGGSSSAAGGRLQVVAAENFWGSIVRQLAGNRADVSSIISNPSTDPHDYEPTAQDARTIASSQLVVLNGAGYDGWAQKLVDANPDPHRVVLNVGDIVHVAAGGNPHQWYSPSSVEAFIRAATARLQRLDPGNATYYANQQTRYESTGLRQYRELIASIRAKYSGTPIGASESIVTPLATALGLTMETPETFLDAIAEGNDPTAGDKALADEQVNARKIAVFVYNSQNATPDVKRLLDAAKKVGIPVTTVTETLTPAGATFQAWQSRQLRQLRDALAAAKAAASS